MRVPTVLPTMVGEALSLPKLMQLNVSMNIERLRRSGRLRAAPTGAVKTGGWRVARLSTPTELKNFWLVHPNAAHTLREEAKGAFAPTGCQKGLTNGKQICYKKGKQEDRS